MPRQFVLDILPMKLDELEERIDELDEALKEKTKHNEDLESKNEHLTEVMQDLEGQVDHLESSIQDYKNEAHDAEREASYLREELSEQKDHVTGLTKLASKLLIALHISNRFISGSSKDLVHFFMLKELKVGMEEFFDDACGDYVEYGHMPQLKLPDFDDKEEEDDP